MTVDCHINGNELSYKRLDLIEVLEIEIGLYIYISSKFNTRYKSVKGMTEIRMK